MGRRPYETAEPDWSPPAGIDPTDWQPIDTAPKIKNGPLVQVRNIGGEIRDTWWDGENWVDTGRGFRAVEWRLVV